MAGDSSFPTLYEVPYLRLFPWLRLFRAPGGAADPKRLGLAVVGLLLLWGGWSVLDRLFSADAPLAAGLAVAWDPPGARGLAELGWSVAEPFLVATAPFRTVFDPSADARAFAHAALAGVWAMIVWGLCGGAIARSTVLALARGQRLSWVEAGRFLARKGVALVLTPLLPFIGVAVLGGSLALFGVLYRLGPVGQTAAGALGFLPLVGGLLLTLVVVLLGAGWPLMHAAVATEQLDSFDAMSRSYAYVHQRPWHLAGYVLLAGALGLVGLAFVQGFATLVLQLTTWGLTLGGPADTVRGLHAVGTAAAGDSTAAETHAFWRSAVAILVHGWIYSYFWTASATIYLLLRQEVDGAPLGMIASDAPPSLLAEAAAGAPPEVFAPPVGTRKSGPAPGVPAPHAPLGDDRGQAADV